MDTNTTNIQTETDKAILAKLNKRLARIDLQSDLFKGITFPSLPHNFELFMSKIDWPTKSKNPSGTLFTDPREIDRNDAEDIAM